MTDPVFQEASLCLEKYDREALVPDAGQRSRAIIPGDVPGDQQPPERGFYPDPHAVAGQYDFPKIKNNNRLGNLVSGGGPWARAREAH